MPGQSPSISAQLSTMPLFSGLSPECLASLGESARVADYARGEIIFRKGEEAKGFYAVLSGKVKLFFVSERGAEKVVHIAGPGMTFGEAVVFINKPYPVFAQPLGASRLIYIPRDSLLQAMAHHQPMALRLLAGLSRRLHGMMTEMEAICIHSSRERVIGYLLAELQAVDDEDVVQLPATKLVVASLLNLSPETFSRILHDLEKQGLLSIEGRAIRVLDVERLRESEPC